jgi:hypothetical protein
MRALVGLVCVAVLGCGSANTSDAGVSDAGPSVLWPLSASRIVVRSADGYPSCVSEEWTLTFNGRLEFTTKTVTPGSTAYGDCVTTTGSRPLNQADLDRLDTAMKALTRPTAPQCNIADGPSLYSQVTTPDGTLMYREAGRGCLTSDNSVTVSGLPTVLDTLRNWAP